MSLTVVAESVKATSETGAPEPGASGHAVPRHVARRLISGTSALGAGLVIERGFGFLANLLAARFGGASTFGAYSLAISTANNIGTYAAGQIGSTAARFSGQYARGTAGYPTLARVLMVVSLVSAAIATLGLWAGAGPIAQLLQKPSLTTLLQWASFSAAGMILVECSRGFFVGQHRLPALLLLSIFIGVGLLALLPYLSQQGPVAMISAQAAVTIGAATLCLLLYKPLGLASPTVVGNPAPFLPMLREVWSFGLVQLAGLIGMNVAGWWLTSLIARADTTMVQVGFFAISLQLRNMVSLAPGLLTESSYAFLSSDDPAERTPDQVMAVCTFATVSAAFTLAGVGMIVLPWVLPLLYGQAYAAAVTAASLALATAVIHMGTAPASARLSILSLRWTGLINTMWAVLVAAGATALLLVDGSALRGAAIYLVAHLFSMAMVVGCLARRGAVTRGVLGVFAVGSAASCGLSVLAVLRGRWPEQVWPLTAGMLALFAVALLMLGRMGRQYGWLPPLSRLRSIAVNRLANKGKGQGS